MHLYAAWGHHLDRSSLRVQCAGRDSEVASRDDYGKRIFAAAAPVTTRLSAPRKRASLVCRAALGLDGHRLPQEFIELTSEEQLNTLLAEAEEKNETVLIDW